MRLPWRLLGGLLAGALSIASAAAQPVDVRVAVAANFRQTLEELGAAYGRDRARLILSSGATGLLYSQIVQGAPFDLFFSADVERPMRLEREGRIVAGSRFTYAAGRVVLWVPGAKSRESLLSVLRAPTLRVLSMANPKLAPYGLAAQHVLERLQLWQSPPFRIVQGESLAQAWQFVATGNADAGFVALSQIHEAQSRSGRRVQEEIIEIDPSLYAPIEQQAVLLSNARNRQAAEAFLAFVKSEAGGRVIVAAGYSVSRAPGTAQAGGLPFVDR